jgi:hypothetical protein
MRLLRSSFLALGLLGLVAGCHTAGICDCGCDGGWCDPYGAHGAVTEVPGGAPVYGAPMPNGDGSQMPKGDKKTTKTSSVDTAPGI